MNSTNTTKSFECRTVTKPNKIGIPKQWSLTSLKTARTSGGWCIKASVSSLDTFCVVMYNEKTDDCHTGFFTDELEANKFIECILEKT